MDLTNCNLPVNKYKFVRKRYVVCLICHATNQNFNCFSMKNFYYHCKFVYFYQFLASGSQDGRHFWILWQLKMFQISSLTPLDENIIFESMVTFEMEGDRLERKGKAVLRLEILDGLPPIFQIRLDGDSILVLISKICNEACYKYHNIVVSFKATFLAKHGKTMRFVFHNPPFELC